MMVHGGITNNGMMTRDDQIQNVFTVADMGVAGNGLIPPQLFVAILIVNV